ncbi:ATP-binding protein [Chitinispirillales bacterium ANBcel5]|uniref:hybrid sensor histidine kinase/response regulator n=1 Tax=Cellulosispirillum alkaliphilum TaxID=3039283 RepID=UPI002A5649A6|nr:ATP-binding protein [Chitinispirillales bacterium ANBcel5]
MFQTFKEEQNNSLGFAAKEKNSHYFIAWVKLILSSFYLFVATFYLLLEQTDLFSYAIQLTASLFILIYSLYCILTAGKNQLSNLSLYSLVFLDVTVFSAIFFTYLGSGYDSYLLLNAVYGIYLLSVIMTALHNQIFLSLFSGIVCSAAYSLFYYFYWTQSDQIADNHISNHFINILVLLATSAVSAHISRNNFRSSQKLINSELKYLSVVHRLPEMLFTLNDNGRFLWANAASRSILGVEANQLLGKNIENFIPPNSNFRLKTSGIKGTYEIEDYNGNHKYVDCMLQYISNNGSCPLFEGIMLDVTDRELAIKQREEMVQRLFQYQKMDSLGTLASGMAHDFNNILQTIKDISEVVIRDSSESDTKKRMELIDETLADAKFLVSELLALGRKQPLDDSIVNMKKLLQTIVPLYDSQLGDAYKITLRFSDHNYWLHGDQEYLKRVFQNLFGNARDSMPNGGTIRVSCSLVKETDHPSILTIRVSDTGSGIPPRIREKVFDPFFTTKKKGKGTGLGLALVHRIIMLHKGNISIEDNTPRGTTFKIELPLADYVIDETTASKGRMTSTVLLLDDDPKIQEVMKFFLEDLNYTVCEAVNQESAKAELIKNRDKCDLVIMDWSIENEDPVRIINSLRQIKRDITIIVVSGYPPNQQCIESFKIHRWFTKPYDKNRLDSEIQYILQNKEEQMYSSSAR